MRKTWIGKVAIPTRTLQIMIFRTRMYGRRNMNYVKLRIQAFLWILAAFLRPQINPIQAMINLCHRLYIVVFRFRQRKISRCKRCRSMTRMEAILRLNLTMKVRVTVRDHFKTPPLKSKSWKKIHQISSLIYGRNWSLILGKQFW